MIDARGGWILPGLIEAHCHIGITEEKKGFEGDDCNEVNQPVIPYLKALDAVNPMDSAFHNALSAGITAVMVGIMAAQCGGRPVFGHEDPWPGDGSDGCQRTGGDESSLWRKSKNKLQRTEQSSVHPYVRRALLRDELTRAQNYCSRKETAQQKGEAFEEDYQMECWLPVLTGKIPMKAMSIGQMIF